MSDIDTDERDDLPESVKAATAFLKLTESAWGKQRKREQDDLKFQIPDPEHQWDSFSRSARSAQLVDGVNIPPRPMLCVSTLDEPIQLELNQERSAHLGVTIHPLTEDASDDTAEILQGLYRHIEQDSRAHLARTWCYDRAVKAGFGCYRITTEYDPSGEPGDQRLMIKRVLYQDSMRLDPFAQEPDFSDAMQGMILERMPRAKFKKRYGKSKLASASESDWSDYVTKYDDWFDSSGETQTVLVAEYYWIEENETSVEVANWKTTEKSMVPKTTRTLYRAVVTAVEELEKQRAEPGRYIPFVGLIGRELQPVDGERYFMGMIRPAAGGAQLANFGASQAVTMAAYEPLAPWMMAEGQDEGHKMLWEKSNTLPVPVLKYKSLDLTGRPAPPPQRVQVDASRLGPSMLLLDRGKEFVQSATAKYGPALGQQTPAHRSGRAIEALQGQSVEANSNYLDNLAQVGIPHEACIVLDKIPFYYDRPGRVATILDENLKPSQVILNAPFVPDERGRPKALPYDTPEQQALADQQVADPNHPAKHYNLNKGRYGVSVTVGKSTANRLQAGADAIGQVIAADPQILPLIGPEWVHFQDFPGKDALEKILRKNRDHNFPWLSETPDTSTQALAQAQQQIQMLTQQLQQLQADADKNRATLAGKQIDAQTKVHTTQIQEQAENQRAAMDREVKLAVAELGAKVDRMALFLEERSRLGAQQHEAAMSAQEHAQALEASETDHSEELNAAAQQAALTPPEPVQASV
jgi:hypothetical protein